MWQRVHRLAAVAVTVSGRSMEPTYPEGATVWIRPWTWWRRPRRGDVVAVCSPEAPERLELKRIVGIPGDRVSWDCDAIWIVGRPLDEPCAGPQRPVPGDDEARRSVQLGACDYFVVGDHRPLSRDSRAYGPVPRRLLVGRLVDWQPSGASTVSRDNESIGCSTRSRTL